jgi:hypothetical protein
MKKFGTRLISAVLAGCMMLLSFRQVHLPLGGQALKPA